MEVLHHEIKNMDVLTVRGRIDVRTSQELKKEVLSVLDSGSRDVCLEFSNVEYMDTSGLGSVVGLFKEARKRDITLTIANPSNFIQGLFKLTQMDKIFPVINDPVFAKQ